MNQGWLEIKDTHQHLVYADDVNVLGGSNLSAGKNIADFLVTNKKAGLEVNSDKMKYMAISCDVN